VNPFVAEARDLVQEAAQKWRSGIPAAAPGQRSRRLKFGHRTQFWWCEADFVWDNSANRLRLRRDCVLLLFFGMGISSA
jgi:hypothetical protein